MDPNATLDEMREVASRIIDDLDNERQTDPDDVQRLAECVQALDNWITSDGFLPNSWERQS